MSRFEKFANLPLRLGVGIVVLNKDYSQEIKHIVNDMKKAGM